MTVAFLSRPVQAPAAAIPRLAHVSPDRRPVVLVARPAPGDGLDRVEDALEAMGIALERDGREEGDPLVALWLGAPAEWTADVARLADALLLGGGWPLLDAVLGRLESLPAEPRAARVAALADLPGVALPDASGRAPVAADILPGGLPFSR